MKEKCQHIGDKSVKYIIRFVLSLPQHLCHGFPQVIDILLTKPRAGGARHCSLVRLLAESLIMKTIDQSDQEICFS